MNIEVNNPFTLTYKRLHEIARNNKILGTAVKEGNTILLDGKGHEKRSVSSADFPELILTSTTLSGELIASSSMCQLQISYNWLLSTGSWDIVGITSQMMWGLLTTSSVWCCELTKLKWKDNSFVKNAELGTVAITVTDTGANRGIQGWSINWPLLVDMYLPLRELRNYQWESTSGNMAR